MKTIKIYFLALIALTFITTNIFGQEKQDSLPTKAKWDLVAMQGTVTAIAKETREITLMGPDGDLVTIVASEEVERFDEIAVGDVLTFEYWNFMKAEFREPTAGEIAQPLVVITEAGKAPEGMDPGAKVGAVVRAVVTIEVLNRPYMTATVQGPGGNYMTIQMEDRALIEKLHIGQVFILTYAEAITISLEKVNQRVEVAVKD